jgi:hypothetical protein
MSFNHSFKKNKENYKKENIDGNLNKSPVVI